MSEDLIFELKSAAQMTADAWNQSRDEWHEGNGKIGPTDTLNGKAAFLIEQQAAKIVELEAARLDTNTPVSNVMVTGFRGNPLRVVLSSGGEATIGQKLLDKFASPSLFEKHPDDIAVDRFAAAMKAKLAKKRADGAGGWDDPEVCHIDYLVHLLSEQIHSRAALDLVDIGNYAMMIFNRPGEKISHGR